MLGSFFDPMRNRRIFIDILGGYNSTINNCQNQQIIKSEYLITFTFTYP